jgi:hypothetical protein
MERNQGNPKILQINVQTMANMVEYDHFKIDDYGKN